jgi:hypothetical protein
MIQDGINYGIGYCKATEPGPDVECRMSDSDDWGKNTDYNTTTTPSGKNCYRSMAESSLIGGNQYRQPIKLQLQAGESYYMRNGEVVGPIEVGGWHSAFRFTFKGAGATWNASGAQLKLGKSEKDLVEHIPKQKEAKMNDKYIKVQNAKNIYYAEKTLHLEVPISEAERLGEEAKRMREENKIKAGDFVMRNDNIYKVVRIDVASENLLIVTGGYFQCVTDCTKITNPAHIKALTEIYEAMK